MWIRNPVDRTGWTRSLQRSVVLRGGWKWHSCQRTSTTAGTHHQDWQIQSFFILFVYALLDYCIPYVIFPEYSYTMYTHYLRQFQLLTGRRGAAWCERSSTAPSKGNRDRVSCEDPRDSHAGDVVDVPKCVWRGRCWHGAVVKVCAWQSCISVRSAFLFFSEHDKEEEKSVGGVGGSGPGAC